MIFRRVFFPASTVPKMYGGGGNNPPSDRVSGEATTPRLRVGLLRDFPAGKSEAPRAELPLVEPCCLLSLSACIDTDEARCLLLHRGIYR